MVTYSPFFIFFLWLMGLAQLDEKKGEEMLASNNTFPARVKAVPSGDTISIDLEGEIISVRLAEIDSPEPRQEFGRQAQRFTEDLVLNQLVKVKVKFVDKFQRVVAEVMLRNDHSLNAEVVRWGYAWHYKVAPEPKPFLEQMEYEAWKNHLGLWVNKNPVPPWKFRSGTTIPNPPISPNEVDYDRIFEYGLFGNKNSHIYSWPSCLDYKIPEKENRIIFSSKLEAESLGYQAGDHCPKQ